MSTPVVPFPKSPLKHLYDFFGLPFRTALLKDQLAEKAGFTSLEQERINAVWPYLKGRILDLGAGFNRLVNTYGNGVGIDVHDWGGGAHVVPHTATLPYRDGEFDTVTMLACLNHITTREQTLQEVRRVLKPNSQCLVTMINPGLGYLAHTLRRHDECHTRGMHHDELNGLWHQDVLKLLQDAGLPVIRHTPFFYGLNRLYIAVKAS